MKIIPIAIKTEEGLISYLRLFKSIKKTIFQKNEQNELILKIRLKWYYLFPYSLFEINRINKQLQEHISLEFKVKIQSYWF